MNYKRMSMMIPLLQQVHQEGRGFDIGGWVMKLIGSTPDPRNCGTAACAIGWAAQDPWFIAEGLTLRLHWSELILEPAFENRRAFDAVALFFDIRLSTAERLFSIEGYNTAPSALGVQEKLIEFLFSAGEDETYKEPELSSDT